MARTPVLTDADVLGRPFRITHIRRDHTWTPAGGETQLDRPLLSGTHSESLHYDHAGNVVAMTDPRAIVVARSWFDARGALVHTRSPDSGQGWVLSDAVGRTVRLWTGVVDAAVPIRSRQGRSPRLLPVDRPR